MERRELIKMIALVTGGAVIGGEFFLSGCKNPRAGASAMTFTEKDIAFLDEVAETILPKTGSAGAKEAKVGQFMTVWVNDCYPKADQEAFHEGIKKLEELSQSKNGKSFMDSTPEQRRDLLISLEQVAKDFNKAQREKDQPRYDELKAQNKDYDFVSSPSHYYTMMKQMTLLGYFTSKEGVTTAQRYVPVPGKYDGSLDYKKGDKLFAGLGG